MEIGVKLLVTTAKRNKEIIEVDSMESKIHRMLEETDKVQVFEWLRPKCKVTAIYWAGKSTN